MTKLYWIRAMPYERGIGALCRRNVAIFIHRIASATWATQCCNITQLTYEWRQPSPLRLSGPCPMRTRSVAASRFNARCSMSFWFIYVTQRNVTARASQCQYIASCGIAFSYRFLLSLAWKNMSYPHRSVPSCEKWPSNTAWTFWLRHIKLIQFIAIYIIRFNTNKDEPKLKVKNCNSKSNISYKIKILLTETLVSFNCQNYGS